MQPSYFRRSGSSATLCDNCGEDLKRHKLVDFDRDGELHECPRKRGTKKPTAKASGESLRTQLLAVITLARDENYNQAADFIKEAMKDL